MSITLNQKVKEILKIISHSIGTTDIISINASISASRMHTTEGDAFKVIAQQVRAINSSSKDNLLTLQNLFDEVKELTEVINIAGKQRMLAQKILKTHLLIRLDINENGKTETDLQNSIEEFQTALNFLEEQKINSTEINTSLHAVEALWLEFKESLRSDNLSQMNDLNNALVTEMNKAVGMYQLLAG